MSVFHCIPCYGKHIADSLCSVAKFPFFFSACKCYGNSECKDENNTSICLKCHNNTTGSQCQFCKKHFVGDPTSPDDSSRRCQPCSEYCHSHSEICVSREEYLKTYDVVSAFILISIGTDAVMKACTSSVLITSCFLNWRNENQLNLGSRMRTSTADCPAH